MSDDLRALTERLQDRTGLWLCTFLSYASVFLLGLSLGRGDSAIWYDLFGATITTAYLITKHRGAAKIRRIYFEHIERSAKASSV